MKGITPTSAQTAKDRLLNLKAGDKVLIDPAGIQPDITLRPLSQTQLEKEFMEAVEQLEPQVANSVEATLTQRGSRYGDFTDHARLCQGLMSEMICFNTKMNLANSELTPWEKLDPVKKQALTVIMDKIARILSGDPNYDDNWHDIQGYAKLVEDRLPGHSVGKFTSGPQESK